MENTQIIGFFWRCDCAWWMAFSLVAGSHIPERGCSGSEKRDIHFLEHFLAAACFIHIAGIEEAVCGRKEGKEEKGESKKY
jgi:hypothetical protein